jgi:hypothetical protein
MEATLKAQLDSIRAAEQEFDQQVESPAPVDELVRLTTAARQQLQGYNVPQTYLDILAVTNGIEWNGCQLYASRDRTFLTEAGRAKYAVRGLVEANEAWRVFDHNRGYVYYGGSGLDLYRHNLASDGFEICTRIGLTVVESFHTADELLTRVFELMLE